MIMSLTINKYLLQVIFLKTTMLVRLACELNLFIYFIYMICVFLLFIRLYTLFYPPLFI
jgi:hypothetical protein